MPKAGAGTYENQIERCGLSIRYLRISSGPQRDRYVHQIVAEAMLGRPLREGEEVDHLNGNTLDNVWTNLAVTTTAEHARETRRRAHAKNQERKRARETEGADAEDRADA
jgi:HNH endonuclease